MTGNLVLATRRVSDLAWAPSRVVCAEAVPPERNTLCLPPPLPAREHADLLSALPRFEDGSRSGVIRDL
jgi:hypothetical protein